MVLNYFTTLEFHVTQHFNSPRREYAESASFLRKQTLKVYVTNPVLGRNGRKAFTSCRQQKLQSLNV